ELLASGAPIDGFGLGTRLVTSADAPYLDCAYKLVEYAGRPRRKRSEGKASWPGRKQVWRRHGDDGRMREDVLALADDPQAGTALLVPVMRAGRRVGLSPSLAASRAHAAAELGRLPEVLRRLEPGAAYPVTVAPALAPWPRPWTGGELSPDRARRRLARGRAAARRARPWAHARARRQRRLRHGLVDRPVAAREPRLLSAGGEHARAPAALLRASFSRGRGGRDLLRAAVGGERARLGRAHARRLRLRREGLRRAHAASARARPSGPGPPARAPARAASQAERV